jgi:hypothetical protein
MGGALSEALITEKLSILSSRKGGGCFEIETGGDSKNRSESDNKN